MLIKTTNFQTKVSERYQNVRSSGDFTDVTLVSEDYGRIDTHKVILATASRVFKDLFQSLNHTNPNDLHERNHSKPTKLTNTVDLFWRNYCTPRSD